MILSVARKLFGTQNDRELKAIQPWIVRTNELEAQMKPLSDGELAGKTAQFKERISRGESLDSLLPEAFAVVREAGKRVLGQRHYDVQLIGGAILHRGRIAEMRTGEGKTLVATLPSYLNALSGKGVHVVTVNEYLAKRDAEWMGRLHRFLGLSVGMIGHGLNDRQRQASYACDITYGTNSEFGFDYLRDNMKFSLQDYVQRELNFAIVDEVDSILIDEARTPLIISGPTEDSTDKYYLIDRIIPRLSAEADYTIDEKAKNASLTESGVEKVEKALNVSNLYEPQNIELVHHVNQALKAHVIFKKDVDYVVRDGEVLIVDEFTGRVMPGRRWSDGLHQAIEAKEGVKIENENQTLATITYQNFFRMYQKLSGMTGTADTEATEFKKIYNLDVVVVPTNRPMVRQDMPDLIYKSAMAKYKAIVGEVKEAYDHGQPVLVGTVSIEKSELLSQLLDQAKVPHNVLNAKNHQREAEIVAQAGRKKSVTIATNMAGRGTDILLGGNAEFMARREAGEAPTKPVFLKTADPVEVEKSLAAYETARVEYEASVQRLLESYKAQCAQEREEVMALGGLFIVGTERHESRRIDNQLRGRAGRQGDPGRSRFFLSLEDDLMRIFGSVNVAKYMEEDVPIEHKWVTRAIENAQKKVEAHNFDIRKHLLEYDDVMNQQRKVVYGLRREILKGEGLREMALGFAEDVATHMATDLYPDRRPREFQLKKDDVEAVLHQGFALKPTQAVIDEARLKAVTQRDHLVGVLVDTVAKGYEARQQQLSEPVMNDLCQMIMLTTIDHYWKDHLLVMDHLRDGIGLRGYGQKDPLLEYKKEGFATFEAMYNIIAQDAVRKIFEVELAREDQIDAMAPKAQPMTLSHPEAPSLLAGAAEGQGDSTSGEKEESHARSGSSPSQGSFSVSVSSGAAVGRNDPCPCGSGKKYKKCHGA